MTILGGTFKLAKELKIDLAESEFPLSTRSDFWYLTVFRFLKKRMFLAVHAKSMFSILATEVKTKDLFNKFNETLGYWVRFYEFKKSEEVIFRPNEKIFKCNDKKLISSVNRLVFEYKWTLHAVLDEHGELIINEIQKRMQDNIFTITNYEDPRKLFEKYLNEKTV